jgi:hypothetical protein
MCAKLRWFIFAWRCLAVVLVTGMQITNETITFREKLEQPFRSDGMVHRAPFFGLNAVGGVK